MLQNSLRVNCCLKTKRLRRSGFVNWFSCIILWTLNLFSLATLKKSDGRPSILLLSTTSLCLLLCVLIHYSFWTTVTEIFCIQRLMSRCSAGGVTEAQVRWRVECVAASMISVGEIFQFLWFNYLSYKLKYS